MKARKLYYKKKDKNSIKWASISECKKMCFARYDRHADSLDCRYDYKCKYCGSTTKRYDLYLAGKEFANLWICKNCSYHSNNKEIVNKCCTKKRGSARWW